MKKFLLNSALGSAICALFLTSSPTFADQIDDKITEGRETYCRWAFHVMDAGINAYQKDIPLEAEKDGQMLSTLPIIVDQWDTLTDQERSHFTYYFVLGHRLAESVAKSPTNTGPQIYGLSYADCMGRKDLRAFPRGKK